MAYNYQQVPFWDFIRSFDQNGAGVDHPAATFPFGYQHFPHPGHPGEHHPPPPHTFGFGGPDFFGPRGFGGGRGGRRGRHWHRGEGAQEPGSRGQSPNGEHAEGEEREGEPREGSPHAHGHGGPHGFGHRGRGGFGRRGGCHGRRNRGPPPPPTGGPAGFDLSALFESLSAHPLAQAFRTYAEQAAGQSGEAQVPEDTEDTNFTPPIDIFSTERAYVLHVSLPGAKKEDVGVNWDAEKGALNLAGVVYRQGDEEFLKSLSKSERKVGVFERTVKLPPGNEEKEDVDGDSITAKLEDGVLVVTVPKLEKEWTEVKRVDIS